MRLFFLLCLCSTIFNLSAQNLPILRSGSYHTGSFNNHSVASATYDRTSQKIFYLNKAGNTLNILDISDMSKIIRRKVIDLSQFTNQANYVSSNLGSIAVAGEGSTPQSNGKVLFFDLNGQLENQLTIGPKPRMLTYTPDGSFLLVANQGEPSDDYSLDPQASLSIISMGSGPANLTSSDVATLSFDTLNFWLPDSNVRVFGNNGMQSIDQDLEPEFIASNPTSNKAFVSMPKNNALMVVDIYTAKLDTILSWGYMDRSVAGNGLDASSATSTIDIRTYPKLFGMYQPGYMHSFNQGGNIYLATANSGSYRKNTAYDESVELKFLPLDPFHFNTGYIQADDSLGLLRVSNAIGDKDGDGLYESIYTFGTRSFSIRDAAGQLIWDSGDDFEQILAQAHPNYFNSNNTSNNSYKSRSPERGPEPSAITTGVVDGVLYAFIALEQMGGIMIYDLSNPQSPQFVQYELNRDFNLSAQDPDAGDLGTQTIQFIPAIQGPSSFPMLVLANTVSGSVSIYEMGQGIGFSSHAVPMLNLYPNPVETTARLSSERSFLLYDSQGKLVREVNNAIYLNMEDLAEGLYILKSSEGETLKVIKR